MLPDYPKVKKELLELWTRWMYQRQRSYLGVVGEIPVRTSIEGEQWVIERADGTDSKTDFELVDGTLSIRSEEIPHLSEEALAKKLDELARELAESLERSFFRSTFRELDSLGRMRNVSTEEVDHTLILNALEDLAIDFDRWGNPHMPTAVVSPEIARKIKPKLEKAENDPSALRQLKQIIDKKRVEWRDRESRRKLVE